MSKQGLPRLDMNGVYIPSPPPSYTSGRGDYDDHHLYDHFKHKRLSRIIVNPGSPEPPPSGAPRNPPLEHMFSSTSSLYDRIPGDYNSIRRDPPTVLPANPLDHPEVGAFTRDVRFSPSTLIRDGGPVVANHKMDLGKRPLPSTPEGRQRTLPRRAGTPVTNYYSRNPLLLQAKTPLSRKLSNADTDDLSLLEDLSSDIILKVLKERYEQGSMQVGNIHLDSHWWPGATGSGAFDEDWQNLPSVGVASGLF